LAFKIGFVIERINHIAEVLRAGVGGFEKSLLIPAWSLPLMALAFFLFIIFILFWKAPRGYRNCLIFRYIAWFGFLAGAFFFVPEKYRFIIYYLLAIFVFVAFLELKGLASLWAYLEKKIKFINDLIQWMKEKYDVNYDVKFGITDVGSYFADEKSENSFIDYLLALRSSLLPFDSSLLYIYAVYSRLSTIFQPLEFRAGEFFILNAFAAQRKSKDSEAWILAPVSVLFLNRDALTYLMAHEFGHHYFGHTLGKGLLERIGDFFKSVFMGSVYLLMKSKFDPSEFALKVNWSQQEEMEADLLAAKVLAERGMDIDEALKLFSYFELTSQKWGFWEKIFSTHPVHEERVRNIWEAYHRHLKELL